jgi:hypothetical protein
VASNNNKMHSLKMRLFDRSQFSLCGRDGYGADSLAGVGPSFGTGFIGSMRLMYIMFWSIWKATR